VAGMMPEDPGQLWAAIERDRDDRAELITLARSWKSAWEQMKAERDELAVELRSRGYGWVVSRILNEKA